jgi:hypothetical protein
LVNSAWRNGPVEDVHAGAGTAYPIDQRRVTLAEERLLMRSASEGFALGMSVCERLEIEQPQRTWPEQVLPYCFAPFVTPAGWSLTEFTREVRLPVGSV